VCVCVGGEGVDWRAVLRVQERVVPYGATCRRQRASLLILIAVDNREQFTLVAACGGHPVLCADRNVAE
jgi:hypothetical protein